MKQFESAVALEQALDDALRLFEAHPDYARTRLDVGYEIKKATDDCLPASHGAPERQKYALKVFNIWARAFLKLVTDIQTQNVFKSLLLSLEPLAWQEYMGAPPHVLRPVGEQSAAFVKAVRICSQRFANAGYKRLAGPSAPQATTRPDAALDLTARLQWKDIKIHFVNTETIEVTVGQGVPQNRTFADLGFANKKSKPPKPREAWETLQTLAVERGYVSSGTEKIQKRIQEIRKVLRKEFGIPDDPIPCEGGKYHPLFSISGEI